MTDEPRRALSWQATGRTLKQASLRAFDVSERTAKAGWRSQQLRVKRWRSRLFMIIQISVAAGISWGIARYWLGHESPFLATVAAIICLGFSFGQRLGRVVEVAVGVALGVAIGDLFVHFFGTGVWQIMLVIGVALSVATWLGARTLMVTQAAVQAATVLTVAAPGIEASVDRWLDALIGCTVALIFATVAPTSPINRPRILAAKVLHEAALTVRAMVETLRDGDHEQAERILERARATESELAALLTASNEGMAVVRTSPFLRRHRELAQEVSDLVVPLDRCIRNLRVLARRVVAATYRGERIPTEYLGLLTDFAQVADECAAELFARRVPAAVVPRLRALGEETSHVTIHRQLSTTVMLAQLRSMIVDLMELCGEDYTDARDAVPDMD
ncbi:MAG: aromatic acid exporter family protein [Tessaracoccus sp.]|uniref:FUSC family protein n=1 Tax=Tessaracoccus sp. TaxID=1971211 RepID=UPI001ECE7F35|nr:FUSC family protein [Tessaracoccus sp.]MBK7821319.1 aromatic acid exporter family protein [Tessaracoccus sp.]